MAELHGPTGALGDALDPDVARPLTDAFPAAARNDASRALNVLPPATGAPRYASPPVTLGGEALWIPTRVYNAEPPALALEAMTPQRRLFVHCVLSRHPDGLVRERHAKALLKSYTLLTVPFVVALAADHAVEIVELVLRGLDRVGSYPSGQFERFGRFLYENPKQFELLHQRTVSYWNAHHRSAIPRQDYPGFKLLDAFDRAVAHQANKPRNRAARR